MKNLIKGMISNRFGIVLVALNVCYFVSRDVVRYTFEHIHGEKYAFETIVVEKCFLSGDLTLVLIGMHLSKVIELMNLPAILLSIFSNKFINIAFFNVCFFTKAKFEIAFMVFFVTLQWLFIGWTAKAIARRIQPKIS
jgi:hypothetical protein